MPWHIEQRSGEFCVIKDSDGHNQGCHETREGAVKQMRALYANEPGMVAAADLSPEMLAQAAKLLGVTEHDLLNDQGCGMTAAAIPSEPPIEWFTLPEADSPTPLTVTADGQVYGHLALWETCHTGFLSSEFSQCIQPPRSESGYQFFNLGDPTGKGVGAGNLTYGTGHAPLSMGMQAAAAHYDNTGTVGANVRASDGRLGIWLAGAVAPGTTPEGLRALRSNPPSGDWRPHRHGLELTAALAVPVPGFPVPRSQLALSASGISALILPGLTSDDIVEPRSREFLRRRESLSASVRSE